MSAQQTWGREGLLLRAFLDVNVLSMAGGQISAANVELKTGGKAMVPSDEVHLAPPF